MLFKLDAEGCGNYPKSRSLEWLETNGLGGYACGTIAGSCTRRYHGFLTVALKPPVQRHLFLAGIDETLQIGDQSYALSAHEYPGVINPKGYELLVGFRLDPWPIWTWKLGETIFEREVFMAYGEPGVSVRYRVRTDPVQATLKIRPFLACRDQHSLTHANDDLNTAFAVRDGSVSFQPYSALPILHLGHSKGAYEHEPDWYKDFEYRIEAERGLDYREDLFSPGTLTLDIDGSRFVGVAAAVKPIPFSDVKGMASKERTRRNQLLRTIPDANADTRRLILSSDAFVVQRGVTQQSIVAGYPWFTDWGRDAMIALPGLCLNTGRHDEAREILRSFTARVEGGLLPNQFADDDGDPDYRSIDAMLWFVLAVHRYVDVSGDRLFIAEVLPVLEGIANALLEGTQFGIHVDADGLLTSDYEEHPLTWMDARTGDQAVTPRLGKAVEINALWYNALKIMEAFERKIGSSPKAAVHAKHATHLHENFAKVFWNEERGCLFDVIDKFGRGDPAIRPNQILAISLPHPLLPNEQARSVLDVVTKELLTPMGLRSLAPGEAGYQGACKGSREQRDAAYHNGTVWPWLIGPYVDAYLAIHGRSAETLKYLEQVLNPLLRQLDESGINSVSEICDGDAPHQPRGCFAQAWSVGEVLRAYQRVVAGDHTPTISGLWPVVGLR